MLRVAIVDDDDTIRAELRQMLDGLGEKCRVILEAEDGDEVAESPLLPELDLILTDINMRRMDGIQLIRLIRERQADPEMVVLSNYDDFSLVRDAMKYGASDYLLKYQLTQEALDGVIEACLQKKRGKSRRKDVTEKQVEKLIVENLLRDFVNRRFSMEELGLHLDALGLSLAHRNVALFLIYTEPGEDIFARLAPGLTEALDCRPDCYFWEHHPGCLAVAVFNRQYSAALALSESHLFATELLRQFLPEWRKRAAVCRSGALIELRNLPAEMDRLLLCGENIFYLGTGMVLDGSYFRTGGSLDEEFIRETCSSLLSAAKCRDGEKLEVWSERLLERIAQERCRPMEIRELLVDIFRSLCFTGCVSREEGFFYEARRCLRSHLCTLDDVHQLFFRFRELMKRQEEEGECASIRQALFLVEQKYHTDLTLEQAAAACGYQKNYFCRLFKETYGCSFVEYLTRYRMEKAWQMLTEDFIPVGQMARRVGMEYRQFCRTFQRYYHVTPSDCKKGIRRERREK